MVLVFIPLCGNLYLDVVWKTFVVVAIFIPLLLSLELSEDINKLVLSYKSEILIPNTPHSSLSFGLFKLLKYLIEKNLN